MLFNPTRTARRRQCRARPAASGTPLESWPRGGGFLVVLRRVGKEIAEWGNTYLAPSGLGTARTEVFRGTNWIEV